MQSAVTPPAQSKQLRQSMRNKRQALPEYEQKRTSEALLSLLKAFAPYRGARRIAFYLPNDGEADPRKLMAHALKNGKACFLPVLRPLKKNQLHFVRYLAASSLVKNRFGIQEPRLSSQQVAPPWSLDIVFLPLVAFDRNGTRMGMGGGYYDRSLANTANHHKPLLIGLAHSCQELDRMQRSSWDIPMDAIATENELIITQQRSQPGHQPA